MARPQKQVVDYFPHYCNHKKTMFILEERYGNDGYAFWFKLLEMLGNSKGHCIDLNDPSEMEFLLAKTHLGAVSATEILDLLAKLEAIDPELWQHKVVWCQNFIDGLTSVYQSRHQSLPQKPSLSDQKQGGGVVSPAENGGGGAVSTGRNPQTIGEETIGEETIGEETREDAPAGAHSPQDDIPLDDSSLPDMTPLEEELAELDSWGTFTMDDRAWLDEFLADHPSALPADVRDMRDYWYARAEKDRKVKHSKGQWKQRLRTWLRRKAEYGGGNGNKPRGLPGNQYAGAFSDIET